MSSVPATTHAIHTDALHRAHARSVFAYCVYRLRSREEAEDAVQIVFLNAQRSLERGVEPEFQRAWLLKIAERVVSNVQRASRRRARVEFPVDLAGIADAVAGTGRDASSSRSSARLVEAFARLSEKQRRALVLCEIHGLSHTEASVELGVSPNAVGALLARARRSLAAELSRSGSGSRVRTSGFLSALVDLKWLAGSLGAKLAAGGASLAVVALVSHPGHMLGRETSPSAPHVASAAAMVQERSVARVRTHVVRRAATRAHAVRPSPSSPAPVATAQSAVPDVVAEPAPATVEVLPPPEPGPSATLGPPMAPAPPDSPADVPVLQVDAPPADAAASVVAPTDTSLVVPTDTDPARGPSGRDAGRATSAGPPPGLDTEPCDGPPCAFGRAAHADAVHGRQNDRVPQSASVPPPLSSPANP